MLHVNRSGQPWPRNPTSTEGRKVPRGEGTHTRPIVLFIWGETLIEILYHGDNIKPPPRR